jgi:hypothetical protein
MAIVAGLSRSCKEALQTCSRYQPAHHLKMQIGSAAPTHLLPSSTPLASFCQIAHFQPHVRAWAAACRGSLQRMARAVQQSSNKLFKIGNALEVAAAAGAVKRQAREEVKIKCGVMSALPLREPSLRQDRHIFGCSYRGFCWAGCEILCSKGESAARE